jgi:hypothetical protein
LTNGAKLEVGGTVYAPLDVPSKDPRERKGDWTWALTVRATSDPTRPHTPRPCITRSVIRARIGRTLQPVCELAYKGLVPLELFADELWRSLEGIVHRILGRRRCRLLLLLLLLGRGDLVWLLGRWGDLLLVLLSRRQLRIQWARLRGAR